MQLRTKPFQLIMSYSFSSSLIRPPSWWSFSTAISPVHLRCAPLPRQAGTRLIAKISLLTLCQVSDGTATQTARQRYNQFDALHDHVRLHANTISLFRELPGTADVLAVVVASVAHTITSCIHLAHRSLRGSVYLSPPSPHELNLRS